MYYVYYKIYWSDENPFSIAYLHIIWVFGRGWMDGWIATLAKKTPHLHDIINRHFFNIYIVRLNRIR